MNADSWHNTCVECRWFNSESGALVQSIGWQPLDPTDSWLFLLCRVAQAVLKACEADVKPQLQKYLTTLILSPISSNSDLQHQCYTLIYQVCSVGMQTVGIGAPAPLAC